MIGSFDSFDCVMEVSIKAVDEFLKVLFCNIKELEVDKSIRTIYVVTYYKKKKLYVAQAKCISCINV